MPAALRVLPPDVVRLLDAGRGVFTTAEALDAGVDADRLRRLVRAGLLEPVGRGAYASSRALAEAKPWTAHAIRTRGFVTTRRVSVFASGWSAVAVRGLPALGDPPDLPLAVQPSQRHGRNRRTRFGIVRETKLPAQYEARCYGCPVVGLAWMVVELARASPRADALVVADAVLNRTDTARRGLRRALAHLSGWPGCDAALWVVEHADGRAESVLESLGRLAFIEYGLPVPLSNVWVGVDYPMYRVDHLLPWHWVAFEGDGAQKYREADDPARVIANEKERERYLRRAVGLDVGRYDWQLARYHRDRLAGSFRAIITANPCRSEPVRWWPTDNPLIRCDAV